MLLFLLSGAVVQLRPLPSVVSPAVLRPLGHFDEPVPGHRPPRRPAHPDAPRRCVSLSRNHTRFPLRLRISYGSWAPRRRRARSVRGPDRRAPSLGLRRPPGIQNMSHIMPGFCLALARRSAHA